MIIRIVWNRSLITQENSFFVYTSNTSSGRFKFINYYTNGTKLILLLDTGASFSIIKEEAKYFSGQWNRRKGKGT